MSVVSSFNPREVYVEALNFPRGVRSFLSEQFPDLKNLEERLSSEGLTLQALELFLPRGREAPHITVQYAVTTSSQELVAAVQEKTIPVFARDYVLTSTGSDILMRKFHCVFQSKNNPLRVELFIHNKEAQQEPPIACPGGSSNVYT